MPTVDMLLDEAGLMIEDLAEKSQIPLKRIEAIVSGRWTPSPDDRVRIAEAFGVAIGSIIWGHMMDPRNVRYRRFGFKEDFQKGSNDAADC